MKDRATPRISAARLRAQPMIDYLVEEARRIDGAPEFLEVICARMVAEGIPLERCTAHARTLHPEIFGFTVRWVRDRPPEYIAHYHGARTDAAYENSAIYWLYGGAERFRRRIGNPNVALDFSILPELKAEGYTDYVALRLPFTDGTCAALTLATRRAGGFEEEDVAFFDALMPHLALVFEARIGHRISENVVKTYLGEDAGRRVLRGEVTRGSGEVIEAAILFADIRGFTALSEALPGDQVIELLNAYFESVIEPVEGHGGQVLKLIGDGMLAIFPLRRGGAKPACFAAATAALAAFGNLAEVNRNRDAAGLRTIRIGITLHVGRVIYGNIGASSRLDFTVIGHAVNLVSRMQALCRRFEKAMLFSAEFVRQSAVPALSMGRHELPGVAEPQEVFALLPAEDPYFQTESG
ncbi:MAG: adenylate/guanylate cyclase domain-containing protein [Stellaceae bacterium]